MKASESPYTKLTTIPFHVPELDGITGMGGVSTRKITEIFGPWSIGKSTLAMYLVTSAQQMGMEVCWADTEFSWGNEYAQKMGINIDELELIQEAYAEKTLDAIEEWASGGSNPENGHKDGLIILDSIGQLTPREEVEKGAEGRVIGAQARLVASFARKMKIHINKNNLALVVLNHEYDPIAFGGGAGPNSKFPKVKPSGGMKLEYAKDLSIHLKKTWVEQDGKLLKITKPDGTIGGSFIKGTIFKNKLAGTRDSECVFGLSYGEGVVKDWNLFELAMERGILTKSGNTIYFKDQKLGVGTIKAKKAIHDSPELKQEIKALL